MKPTNLVVTIVLALVAAICFTARTQTSQGVPSSGTGQRYVIVSGGSGQYTETYVLDSQSGRVWMMRGQVSTSPGLIPCSYQLLNGHTVLSPIDGDKEIGMAKQARQSDSLSPAPKSAEELRKELQEESIRNK
jgi:hypothetical protein